MDTEKTPATTSDRDVVCVMTVYRIVTYSITYSLRLALEQESELGVVPDYISVQPNQYYLEYSTRSVKRLLAGKMTEQQYVDKYKYYRD